MAQQVLAKGIVVAPVQALHRHGAETEKNLSKLSSLYNLIAGGSDSDVRYWTLTGHKLNRIWTITEQLLNSCLTV